MDDAAAFKATFAKCGTLTSGGWSFTFHVDGPNAKVALDTLTQGGMPSAAKGDWFVIARLNNQGAGLNCDDSLKSGRHALISNSSETTTSAPGPVTKTSPVRSLSQHAYKLLCVGSLGHHFIEHHRNKYFVSAHDDPKEALKDWIGCRESLSEVDDDPKLAGVLDNILSLFEGWKRGYDKAS